ncbi:hypothetical protein HK098_000094 [Nowakowskiella sp. JEL0407]|nr:hypothetical protein HK098_000094 [Nowakowskiella sp. JEL0407]
MKVSAALLALVTASNVVYGASLVQISNFGSNPTNIKAYEYVPSSIKSPKSLLVAVHFCTGSASAMFNNYDFDSFADKYGYYMMYPETTRSGSCWDVATSKALTRNGGSDPQGIISATNYMISKYGIDKSRVFLVGASSGAMMTNVLVAEYPDIFNAATAFMGVPYGCFATESGGNPSGSQSAGWNSNCANGQVSKSAQTWGDSVRSAYPGYSGSRPRIQLWHGSADTTLNFKNLAEEVKMWTNVAGLSQTPTSTDTLQSGWTRAKYGSAVEAITISGVGHALPMSGMTPYMISFMGLDKTPTTSPATSPKVSPATSPKISNSPATSPKTSPKTSPQSGNCQPIYAQCGGMTYTGSTCCASSSCVKINDWYSQCK